MLSVGRDSSRSPVLSNIFAHYAIDIWITEVVTKYTTSPTHFVRYADDFVICTNKRDAGRILKALKGRLERFSLQLNEDKTKVISFSRMESVKGVKQGVIDFLGFTLYWGKSKKGKSIPKVHFTPHNKKGVKTFPDPQDYKSP